MSYARTKAGTYVSVTNTSGPGGSSISVIANGATVTVLPGQTVPINNK